MISNSARVAFAKQTTLNTASTTGFYTLFASRSSSTPAPDRVANENRHPGIHQRASSQNALPYRTAWSIPINVDFDVHPSALPTLFIGMGFGVTTSDQTTYKRHTIVKSDVDDVIYMSMLHRFGEGSGAFERLIEDVRGTQLVFNASGAGLTASLTAMGISEAAAAGTETVNAENVEPILPTKGSLTWGAQDLGVPREHVVTIARPVDTNDQKVHSFGRADFPEIGFAMSGQMRGLDLSYNFYKKLRWGGTSGTGLAEAIVTDSLSFNWLSANNISGAAVPFKLSIALTKVEIELMNFEAAGAGVVRGDVNWTMIDDVSGAPVTILVENAIASY